MNVWIVGDFTYPNGYGATARVHAYARGLLENGVGIRVVPFVIEGLAEVGTSGLYNGIPYDYGCATLPRVGFWAGRRREPQVAGRIYRSIRGTRGKSRIDAVILFCNSAPLILATVAACRSRGIRCIQEKSEFPFVYDKKTLGRRLYAFLFTHTIYRLFDGMIVISSYLERYFAGRVRRGVPILRVPILVAIPPSGTIANAMDDRQRRILYMGNLRHAGEVQSLIQAFSLVARQFPAWKLQIIGDARGTNILNELMQMAEGPQLAQQVEFTGTIKRDELPRHLFSAGVLVLPRASGLFSQAGFPTKLGEYLMTGKPVVITATGDIPLYLKDGFSAYLVPPDNVEAFAQKLCYVLSHPLEAATVGQRGQEVAHREFNYQMHCRRIKEFVQYIQGLDA